MTVGISFGVKNNLYLSCIKRDCSLIKKLTILEITTSYAKKISLLKILRNIKKHFKNKEKHHRLAGSHVII
jgi:hypothetical protein